MEAYFKENQRNSGNFLTLGPNLNYFSVEIKLTKFQTVTSLPKITFWTKCYVLVQCAAAIILPFHKESSKLFKVLTSR